MITTDTKVTYVTLQQNRDNWVDIGSTVKYEGYDWTVQALIEPEGGTDYFVGSMGVLYPCRVKVLLAQVPYAP